MISLLPAFRFNASIPFVYLFLSFQVVHFVTSFLSLQLFFPVHLALPFLSASISLHPSFRCNISLPFVTSFLSFQNFPPVRLPLPVVSSLLPFQLVHPVSCRLEKTRVAASGCFFEFQPPRVLQQCYSF